MAARSIGSGTISFGLVSIPIRLYTATSPKAVSFHMLHKKCGSRIKQQLYCPVDNEVVDRSDIVKGYEHARDTYVTFSNEELKAMESARTDTLELVQFVPAETVDLLYIEKTYYLGPDKGGERAYRLLAESLERADRLAVGRFQTRGKDNLVLVRAYKKGLILHQAYYADEVRDFDEVDTGGEFHFKPIELELADKLIQQLDVKAFDPSQFHDTYVERVQAAVDQKVAGEEVVAAPEQPKAQIIDLLEALKRSVADAGEGAKAHHAHANGHGRAHAANEDGHHPKRAAAKGPRKAAPRKDAEHKKKKATG